jgi:hypothetical protein
MQNLPQGTAVPFLAYNGDWCRIQYSSDGYIRTGYVHRSLLGASRGVSGTQGQSVGNPLSASSPSYSDSVSNANSVQENAGGLMQFLGPHEKQVIFKQPDVTSDMAGMLIRGNKFTMIEHSSDGEWANISMENGTMGWIKLYFRNEQGVRKSIHVERAAE